MATPPPGRGGFNCGLGTEGMRKGCFDVVAKSTGWDCSGMMAALELVGGMPPDPPGPPVPPVLDGFELISLLCC